MPDNKVLIIAEAGVNHNGSMALAKRLIDEAVIAGVDIVKFQTFIAEQLMSGLAKQAEYQTKNTGKQETQLDMIKKLELSFADFDELKAYCEKKGIVFMSTPFDLTSIDYLAGLNMPYMKIPSGEITNLPYLKKIGALKTKVIMSTGMADMEEIKASMKVLTDAGTKKEDIILLHCNTEYPTPMEDVNLRAMLTMRDELKVQIGYSDHTEGIEIPVAAVALGATVIEKHFTLDKSMEGPDHKASLNPVELKAMVKSIRNIEAALGSGSKTPSPSEIKNKTVARKSIHAAKAITKGHVLRQEDLTMKRPGDGISPMQLDQVIGKELLQDLQADDKLKWSDLK
jgi:N,N'-diacetyllegionaminate synthase